MSRADVFHRVVGESCRQTVYQGTDTGSVFESAWHCGCSSSFVIGVRLLLLWTVCTEHHEPLLEALTS
jgi:hypothetical protein